MSVNKCISQCHTNIRHLACVTLHYIALQAADNFYNFDSNYCALDPLEENKNISNTLNYWTA